MSRSNRAVQAQAWFAATAIGAAALEAFLLSKCLAQKEEIIRLPKFQLLNQKKKRDFRHFAEGLDLGKLLEIADELPWFPRGGFPMTFAALLSQHLSAEEIGKLLSLFNSEENIGKLCATELRRCRNLLHPAVCLKEKRQPSAEVGLTGTLLLLAAISILADPKPA